MPRTQPRKLPQYVSVAEVCDMTTFSRATIIRFIDSGQLPATQLNRKILVREEDVIALLDKHAIVRGKIRLGGRP